MNGGHGERRLWKRSGEELEIIREYSWLHTELIPYMYHYVVTAHQGGKTLQTPIDGKYHYMFGENLLIAPIYKDELKNEVRLPAGKWRYWFDDSKIIEGPITFEKEYPMDEFPIYIKEGSIIPMEIKRPYTGLGDAGDEGFLTFLIYPDHKQESFEVFREKSKSTILSYEKNGSDVSIRLSGEKCPHILQIALPQKPESVELDGEKLIDETDYTFDVKAKKLRIKTQIFEIGNYLIQM